MITRITHEIHVFIEWKLYLHYNGSGIHVSQQWIHELLIFTCGIPQFFGVESMKLIRRLYML